MHDAGGLAGAKGCAVNGSFAGAFDLQVNGYAGVDFNSDALSDEDLNRACRALQRDGVGGVLATVITAAPERMCARLERLVLAREQDPLVRRVVCGVHIEGPFLNAGEGYAGAHPVSAIRPADEALMQRLLAAAGGLARLVTLAPEQDPGCTVIRALVAQGVAVAAGHCDPSGDQLDAAMDAGLTLFTHVGNGCPLMLHRHDNIVQRVLARADRLWLCFIADGVHIPFPALGNYLRLAGERAIVTTDAMAAAGLGPGRYRLGHWEVEVGDDLAAWNPGRTHLLGSALSMPQASRNLRDRLGLSPEQVVRLTERNPRQALGLEA